MEIPIAVRVPEEDIEELRKLQKGVGSTDEIVVAHPFDGEAVVQLVILLSGAGYPFFRSWLTYRATARKSYSVVHNGTELTGYTASEVDSILKRLDGAAPESRASQPIEAEQKQVKKPKK